MITKRQYTTSLEIFVFGMVVLAMFFPTSAQAITFSQWASSEGLGSIMPSQVDARSASIDSLSGIGNYNWNITPTVQLNLNYNQITSIESGAFLNLNNLDTLILANNQITSVESGDFIGLANLTSLLLHDNEIASIESGDFTGLDNLATLELTSNKITSIESGDFAGLSKLTTLNLGFNQIASVESGDFAGLENLSGWLYLCSNQITSIESGDFSGLGNLTTLQLYSNQIVSIEPGDFSGLDSLTNLDLHSNQITTLKSNGFNGLDNLTRLALSRNQITNIESGAFSGLSNLKYLYLGNNVSLTELNLENADFSSLERLNLEQNINITSVSLKDTVVTQTGLDRLLDGGMYTGIAELPGVTELNLSGIDFSNINDYSSLYTLDCLTDLWLVNVENMDALELDILLNNLVTMETSAIEGTLYMTQLDYDTINTAGGGLLAAWDAEVGHHVQIVPEPTTFSMLVIGMLCLFRFRRWRVVV